jgi:hypothetical protein
MSVLNWTYRDIGRRSLPALGSKRAFPFATATTSHAILSPSLAGPLTRLSNVVAYVRRLSREEARCSCPVIASGKRAASRRLDRPPAALGLCHERRRAAQISPLRCLPNFWDPSCDAPRLCDRSVFRSLRKIVCPLIGAYLFPSGIVSIQRDAKLLLDLYLSSRYDAPVARQKDYRHVSPFDDSKPTSPLSADGRGVVPAAADCQQCRQPDAVDGQNG